MVKLGANTLTLNANGTAGQGILVDNSNSFTLTISVGIKLGNAQSWTNSNLGGTVNAISGSTVSVKGNLTGSTTFYNLTKSVTSADTLTCAATASQTVTNVLTLNGTGIGGLTLTGGIGWILASQGFACDALIGARMVTVDGDVIDIDDQHERELLWGLRGGGGNFGASASSMALLAAASRPGQSSPEFHTTSGRIDDDDASSG
mgnify:CR=1 FL=1